MNAEVTGPIPETQDVTNISFSTIYGHTCDFTPSITPQLPFISLQSGEITVDTSDVADVGDDYPFSYVISPDNYASYV